MPRLLDLTQEIYQGMMVYPGHLKTVIWEHHSHADTAPNFEGGFSYQSRGLLLSDHGPTHVDAISHLDPRPGAAFARQPAEWVRPELRVELTDDDVVVSFVAAHLPALRVSARCAALAADGDAELRAYLRPKLAAARDLIRAVDLRRHTLLAVTTAVMRRQTAFLGEGPRSLLPLRMQAVADAIGVHASTVSRAVAGKWVITPQGTYPLRDFFDTGGAATPAGGDAVGQRGVPARIAELIAGEDPRRPLSDDELSALLASAGVQIARRTVAKHRNELGLPKQSRRRVH